MTMKYLSVAEAIELSKELAKAPNLLPKHAKSAPEILACILAGQELGWPPLASLRGLQLVSGKLTLDASAMLGLVCKAGIAVSWEADGSDGVARLKLVRGQQSHVQQFTRDDAKRAGLNSDTWRKYEPAMLRARCVSACVRAFCPDVTAGGAAYLPGEADGGEELPVGAPVVEAPAGLTQEQQAQADKGVALVQKHFPEARVAFDYEAAIKQCTKREHLVELARVLLEEIGPVSGKPAWRAFANACGDLECPPREVVAEAQKASAA